MPKLYLEGVDKKAYARLLEAMAYDHSAWPLQDLLSDVSLSEIEEDALEEMREMYQEVLGPRATREWDYEELRQGARRTLTYYLVVRCLKREPTTEELDHGISQDLVNAIEIIHNLIPKPDPGDQVSGIKHEIKLDYAEEEELYVRELCERILGPGVSEWSVQELHACLTGAFTYYANAPLLPPV